MPCPGTAIGEGVENGYDRFLKRETRFDKLKVKGKPKNIFVSRGAFKNVGRVAGFDVVASIFEKNGYFELRPETYPLEEQLAYLKAADSIFWEEGSAVHLLDILPKLNASMVLLRRRRDYLAMDNIIRNKSKRSEIYSEVEYINSRVAPHNRMSKLIKPAAFFEFLKKYSVSTTEGDLRLFLRNESLDILEQQSRESEGLSPSTVDFLRDTAVENEKFRPDLAYELMRLAHKARPNGLFIANKLEAYKKKRKAPDS